MLKERVGYSQSICGREAMWTQQTPGAGGEREATQVSLPAEQEPPRKNLWRLSWEIFYRHQKR